MRFVVDANVIFSALIKDSHTRHFLLLSGHDFVVPEFVFEEIGSHTDTIAEKSGMPAEMVRMLLGDIFKAADIKAVPFDDFREFMGKAEETSPDADDAQYFALAMKLGCPIWSNDRRMKQQNTVQILTSEEVMGAR